MDNILNLLPVEVISFLNNYIDQIISVALSVTVAFLVRKVLRILL